MNAQMKPIRRHYNLLLVDVLGLSLVLDALYFLVNLFGGYLFVDIVLFLVLVLNCLCVQVY